MQPTFAAVHATDSAYTMLQEEQVHTIRKSVKFWFGNNTEVLSFLCIRT